MAEKLNAKRVSLSLAAVAGIISIVCALLILIAPEEAIRLFGSIFHGIDISKITVAISWGNAILGTVVAIALALAIGWLFASIYNKIK